MAGAGPLADLGHRLHELEGLLSDPGADAEQVLAEYGDVQGRFEAMGGYALEADARKVLAGLGFKDADADRPVRELSGGWRMRVALARLLLAKPDQPLRISHESTDLQWFPLARLAELAGEESLARLARKAHTRLSRTSGSPRGRV